MNPPQNISNKQIYDELQGLKNEVRLLDRVVRGSNGNPGLAAEVMKQTTRIDEIVDLLKTLIANERKTNREVPTEPITVPVAEKKDETVVRWPYLMDKFFAPIFVGILTAVLITMILHAVAP